MLVLEIAGGIVLGLGAMRLVDHALVLHRDTRRARLMKNELEGAATNFIDQMHDEMMKEKEAEAVKAKQATRRKPATRKAAVKKAPAKTAAPKKGVKNVRRTNR